jgi:hypothetical protein
MSLLVGFELNASIEMNKTMAKEVDQKQKIKA